MEGWRWRIVAALIGLVLFICSACLFTTSRLHIRRVQDSDVIPIEAPVVPESRSLQLGVI
jgi:hypothetical protein